MKRIPYSEAQLLSIYFEELALKSAEDRKEAERRSSSSSNSRDFATDDVIGGDDEIDYFTAQQQGLVP